jgi:hypothetical protein
MTSTRHSAASFCSSLHPSPSQHSARIVRVQWEVAADAYTRALRSSKRIGQAGKYFVAVFSEDRWQRAELWNAETGHFVAKLETEGGFVDNRGWRELSRAQNRFQLQSVLDIV